MSFRVFRVLRMLADVFILFRLIRDVAAGAVFISNLLHLSVAHLKLLVQPLQMSCIVIVKLVPPADLLKMKNEFY